MQNYSQRISNKDKTTAIWLCCLGFIGIAGIHYFYVGKVKEGLIYFFTGGLFFIGTIVDLIKLATGNFTDNTNAKLIDIKRITRENNEIEMKIQREMSEQYDKCHNPEYQEKMLGYCERYSSLSKNELYEYNNYVSYLFNEATTCFDGLMRPYSTFGFISDFDRALKDFAILEKHENVYNFGSNLPSNNLIHLNAYKTAYEITFLKKFYERNITGVLQVPPREYECMKNFFNVESMNFIYRDNDGVLESQKKSFDDMEGHEFEHFCAEILEKNGFNDVNVTQGSGDQGIDIIAFKEGVKYGIQCKCYSGNVGNKAVQEAYAGMKFYDCHVGVVLTNAYFTQSAKELAESNHVLLWDRDKLIELIGE